PGHRWAARAGPLGESPSGAAGERHDPVHPPAVELDDAHLQTGPRGLDDLVVADVHRDVRDLRRVVLAPAVAPEQQVAGPHLRAPDLAHQAVLVARAVVERDSRARPRAHRQARAVAARVPGTAVDVLDAELLLGPLDRGLALRRAPDRGPRAQTVGVLRRRLGVLGLGRRLRVGRGVRGRVRGRRRLVAPALVTAGRLVARAALAPIRSLVARVTPVPVVAVAGAIAVTVLSRVGAVAVAAVAVLTLTPLALRPLALATLGVETLLALALELDARLAGRS